MYSHFLLCFFFKQKTAYEMRISDWSSDVCSSDLRPGPAQHRGIEVDEVAIRVDVDAWKAGGDQRRAMPRRRAVELVDEGVLGAAQHGERHDAAEGVGVLGAAVRTVEDRRRGGPLWRPVAESGLRIDRVHAPSVYGTSPPASSAGRPGRRGAQSARPAHGPSAEMGVSTGRPRG